MPKIELQSIMVIPDGVHVTKLRQDDYDDGIQELVVTLSNGKVYQQKWKWPGTTHEAYYALRDIGTPDEGIFLTMRHIAEQVDGPKLWFHGCIYAPNGFKYGRYRCKEPGAIKG